MLVKQLKNYLESILDEANVLIYINKTNEIRQLIMSDLDRNQHGHIVIDAEYDVQPKYTEIKKGDLPWAKK